MGEAPVRVTFYGARGSTPCAGAEFERFGGQTSCVVIEHGGIPIVLDLGTGFRTYGCALKAAGVTAFRAHVLLTHTHWDHVQGLPFFGPIIDSTTSLEIYGPGDCGQPFTDLMHEFMKPPFFPITPEELPAELVFHDFCDDDLGLGDAKVRACTVPHTSLTNGYRIDVHGVSLAFVPDHQEPIGAPDFVDQRVLELCDGVDLLIHDAQFTPELLAERPDWGHCTVDYAVTVAKRAGVSRLALFHHDPGHDDVTIDALAESARAAAADTPGLDVFAAARGLTVDLGIA